MKIQYDKTLPIAGIGIHPSMRWGPQLWFRDYQVASLIDDLDWQSYSLERYAGQGYYQGKYNTQELLCDPLFREMLRRYFKGRTILTYKPVVAPDELMDYNIRFIPDVSMLELSKQFENKALFRRLFTDSEINLAPYSIYTWRELVQMDDRSNLLAGRKKIVVQDATSSGGKGTFIVSNVSSFDKVIACMRPIDKLNHEVVVSDYVDRAVERSIQGVVTRYGVFIGPVQRQLVVHPQLTNAVVPGAELFCGVEIRKADQQGWVVEEMTHNAQVIGKKLQQSGYRGIFGVDSLVTHEAVYTLEVNARITGATPLLTVNYDAHRRHIPFYLLHILELTGVDYTIEDTRHANDYDDCSLIIPHFMGQKPVKLIESLKMGLYDLDVNFIQPGFAFDTERKLSGQAIIQDYGMVGKEVNPGKRLASIFLKQPATTPEGRLTPEVGHLLDQTTTYWYE